MFARAPNATGALPPYASPLPASIMFMHEHAHRLATLAAAAAHRSAGQQHSMMQQV
jgi:hypothetical protein